MIIFSYKISDIINNSQILSSYRASTSFNTGNVGVVDDTSISKDDESLLNKYLKMGSSIIAQILSGYTDNLLDSDNITILKPFEYGIEDEDENSIVVFRINMPTSFNSIDLIPIDQAIIDGLENYILYRTSKVKGLDSSSYLNDWENSLSTIRSIISRRTQSVKRNNNYF